MRRFLPMLTGLLLVSATPAVTQEMAFADAALLTPGAQAGGTIGKYSFKLTFEATAIDGMDEVRQRFIDNGILAETLDEVAAQIALPQDVPVTFTDCGEPNAWWMSEEKELKFCYEMIALYNTGYEHIDGAEKDFLLQADRETVLIGTTMFILFHELGHGFVDLFQLPITGREEDAVDQFAAITLIESDEEDDELEQRPSRMALIGAYFFHQLAAAPDAITRHILANEHALGQQRFYDVMCLALGANEELYGPILALGIQMVDDSAQRHPELATEERVAEWLERTDDLNILPYKRAFRCANEYARYSASWNYMFDNFMVPQQDY